ncbi:unnamed protein product [Brachionus calyciflorus]|uniref:Uncharacterized protein n=1 Tax=Brachionus calyciflorus TaxID=104777 RepID=A0A813QBZ5_9BILA|nr:unnamed protein product [Brachionus calyciflorus]
MVEISYTIQIKKHPGLNFNSDQYLASQIKNYIQQYDNQFYGPFATLCQSSGFGKTRACEALVNDNFYVVYCCLRKKSSSGFPPRSPAADFIQSNDSKEIMIRKFICYLNLFIENVQNASNENVPCNEFYREYFPNDQYLLELLDKKLEDTTNDSELGVYEGNNPLLFIFDEKSSLLEEKINGTNSYFILRKVLSKLAGNVFVLFLDLFMNLSEYYPKKEADRSGRICSLEKTLFEPIYLLPNWDLFVDYDLIKSMKETVTFENICRFGRVLWGSLMHTKLISDGKCKNVSDTNIYDFAISKLLGGRPWSSIVLDDNECIAASSCRIGTIKSKSTSTSQDLVAKNMAICTYVNTQNDIFEIEYSSEPVLAVASAYLINSFGYEKVMDSLVRSVESSIISLGDRGEIIYLLLNWDLFVDYDLTFENICRFCRVLWGSLMHTKLFSDGKCKNMSDDYIYNLAISKLLGGRPWSSIILDDKACLAASNCRIGTIKSKSTSTSQDLVAKNMAICTYVNTQNDIFEIEYSSEPVLAVSSAYLINSWGYEKVMVSFVKALNHLF